MEEGEKDDKKESWDEGQGKIGDNVEYARRQLAVRGRRLSGNRDNEVRGNQLSSGWLLANARLFPNCIDVRTHWQGLFRAALHESSVPSSKPAARNLQ